MKRKFNCTVKFSQKISNKGKEVSDMGNLPKDPVMLLSYVNTQLRDFYPSMEAFCAAFDIEKEEIDQKLRQIDYQYDEKNNQYV